MLAHRPGHLLSTDNIPRSLSVVNYLVTLRAWAWTWSRSRRSPRCLASPNRGSAPSSRPVRTSPSQMTSCRSGGSGNDPASRRGSRSTTRAVATDPEGNGEVRDRRCRPKTHFCTLIRSGGARRCGVGGVHTPGLLDYENAAPDEGGCMNLVPDTWNHLYLEKHNRDHINGWYN